MTVVVGLSGGLRRGSYNAALSPSSRPPDGYRRQ